LLQHRAPDDCFATSSLLVLETAVLVSRPKFCGLGTAGLGLGLGLEALVSDVFETDQ